MATLAVTGRADLTDAQWAVLKPQPTTRDQTSRFDSQGLASQQIKGSGLLHVRDLPLSRPTCCIAFWHCFSGFHSSPFIAGSS